MAALGLSERDLAFKSVCPVTDQDVDQVRRTWRGCMNTTRGKRKDVLPPLDFKSDEVTKSLTLKTDPRYKEIDYYTKFAGTNDANGHFAKVKSSMEGRECLAAVSDLQATVALPALSGHSRISGKPNLLEARSEWQVQFEQKAKQLLVDFDLDETPRTRIKHLDGLSDWFRDHGGKQAKKGAQAPAFLIADRGKLMPPGSTKDVPTGTSTGFKLMKAEWGDPELTKKRRTLRTLGTIPDIRMSIK